MTAAYLLLSAISASCFYLRTPHQRLCPRAQAMCGAMRVAAWVSAALATAAAIAALGIWAGVFAALTAIMLVAVLLPYADAWRARRTEAGHAR